MNWQALYAYFTGCELEEALRRPWPRHSVLELRPVRNSHLFDETAVSLDPAGEASSAILDELSLAESPHEADEARALGFADATDS